MICSHGSLFVVDLATLCLCHLFSIVNCMHCVCYFSPLHPKACISLEHCMCGPTHPHNHTHTVHRGHRVTMPFMGFDGCADGRNRLQTKYLNGSKTLRIMLYVCVSVVQSVNVSMYVLLECVHLSGKCLSPQATVCQQQPCRPPCGDSGSEPGASTWCLVSLQ